MSPSVCHGLRNIDKVVADNPQWWMLEVFDGFGAHLLSFRAMKNRYESKILSLKEEGDTSHVNQAYDKFVAKSDKLARAESISMVRSCVKSQFHIIDQWGLLLCGSYAVRATTPETWTKSFHACNMDPRSRVSFEAWCDKISLALRVGENCFLNNGQAIVDTYSLLPAFWHHTPPEEKKMVKAMVYGVYGGEYSVACCEALMKSCFIAKKDLQAIQLCLFCAEKCPEQLDMGVPTEANADPVSEELARAQSSSSNINSGLNSFLLKPPGMKGMELFQHLESKMLMSPTSKTQLEVKNLSPSQYINVEMTKENRLALAAAVDPSLTSKRSIMMDAVGPGATKKMARRKLNMFGKISSRCGTVNDPLSLKRMENRVMLAESMAQLSEMERTQVAKKKAEETQMMMDLAPPALDKLKKHNNDPKAAKLLMKEMQAILYHYYGVEVDKKLNKNALINRLVSKVNNSEPTTAAPLPVPTTDHASTPEPTTAAAPTHV
ncbi:MAG TPA: hypothetical protein VLS94_00280 [Fusibacter sp.]|nr:hypothetical protein [Fusibacter sp.]